MRPVWFSSLFQYLVGALCWRAQKGSRECPSTQIEPRSFKGSVRAVCPTPPLQLVSQYTKQFWERKWSKIMQSNSEEERKKRNWHLHECFTGADAACRWFIKKKKKKGSPLDQWLKRRGMFTYRAHVTIIYQRIQRGSKKPKDFDSRLQLGWK